MKESSALLERFSQERDINFRIDDWDDWEALAQDLEKEGIIKKMELENLENVRLLWRGMNPQEALGLLLGQKENLVLASEYPNVTLDWKKAISYNQEPNESIKMNTALGFFAEDDWDIKSATQDLSKDLPEEALKYQQGNFIANGKLLSRDLRFLVIRFWGKEGRGISNPIAYEIDWKKLSQRKSPQEAAA